MTRKHYIYCYRAGVGRRRQPARAGDLAALELAVKKNFNGQGHPYNLSHTEKQELVGGLLEQVAGSRTPATLPDKKYLYRVCSIEDFIYNAGLPLSESEKADPPAVWEQLNTNSGGKWQPVPAGAGMTYSGCGRISWWTDLPLPADVVLGALRIGMFTDWLPPTSVLLRCEVSFVREERLAYVPTVLDAFCQLVFHPRKEQNNPTAGVAIDLSRRGPLRTGASEFILRPVECGRMQYLPTPVTSGKKKDYKEVRESEVELDRLIAYYKII